MEDQEKITTSDKSRSLDAETLKGDAEKLKGKAIDVAEQMKSRGKEQLETGKKTAAEGVEQLAGALDQATESLQHGGQPSLAGYAQEMAASVRSLAANLRDRSLDDLVGETQVLARRNPTLFFFGSVAVGIALSRFLKASGEREAGHFPDNIMPSGVHSARDSQRMQESTGSIPALHQSETTAVHTERPASAHDVAEKGV